MEKQQTHGLVFKKHVKDEQIHTFHIIPLSYRGLQCREDVKDVTEILLLKWIDSPCKVLKPYPCQLFIVPRLPKSIVTSPKWMFGTLK